MANSDDKGGKAFGGKDLDQINQQFLSGGEYDEVRDFNYNRLIIFCNQC